ncbi:MAG: response regulator [Planctomycetota bacterium]
MAKETILIVEDDPDIVELVQYNLEREGFKVWVAKDGESGLKEAASRKPSLIVLDIMLPGMEGLEVCRCLKHGEATKDIPLVMVTAKGEESDVIVGLEMGADDYVVKPFSPRELMARIRAILRRGPIRREPDLPEKITLGPLSIDAARHEVTARGKPVVLTLAEFRLLRALAANPGRVFTRDQLLDKLTGGDVIVTDRTVDVHVSALRKKLKADGDLIVTVRGVGYKCRD